MQHFQVLVYSTCMNGPLLYDDPFLTVVVHNAGTSSRIRAILEVYATSGCVFQGMIPYFGIFCGCRWPNPRSSSSIPLSYLSLSNFPFFPTVAAM